MNMKKKKMGPFQIGLSQMGVGCAEFENRTQHQVAVLKFSPESTSVSFARKSNCRALQGLNPSDIITVSFQDVQMRPADTKVFIMQRIENGLLIKFDKKKRKMYHFFGCSNSQLKDRKAVMICRPVVEIERRISAMGDFLHLNSVAKITKRMGLMFTSSTPVSELEPKFVKEIDDIVAEHDENEILTDGCGHISKRFAQKVTRKADIVFRNERYLPSVYQFRYLGYKGVLSLKPHMPNGICLECRPSMQKFKQAGNKLFGLVKASRPYSFGALNAEHVTLLVEMGVSQETLLKKQREYFEFLLQCISDVERAFQFLVYCEKFPHAQELLERGLCKSTRTNISRLVEKELEKGLKKKGETRIRIVLPNSRLLFGVAEQSSKLGPTQVFVRITINGVPKTLTEGWVLVTRNPCLHPGDIRRLELVDVPEYSHLVDCIVFSTSSRLKRSHASEMSGGDLDGDEFMVIFDDDIVPTNTFTAAEYASAKLHLQGNITRKDRILYFAKFSNSSVGRIKNLYLKWVAEKGARSTEALKLNDLFAACVDGEYVEIPKDLQNAPEPTRATEEFIITRLTNQAKEFASQFIPAGGEINADDGVQLELLESLVHEDCPQGLSDFELFRMINKFRHLDDATRDALFLGIDFAALTHMERQYALTQRPSLRPLITNALSQSMFSNEDLVKFNLLGIGNWKRFYNSKCPGPQMHERVMTAICSFTRKLILLKATDRLTVALYMDERLDQGINALHALHVFSTDHRGFRSHAILRGFLLEIEDGLLQIYRNKGRQNTFIWVATSVNMQDRANSIIGRVSIDLRRLGNHADRRFALIRKEALHDVEIFVLAGQDSRDLENRHLPLWNHEDVSQCEAEIKVCRAYSVLVENDWKSSPDAIKKILERQEENLPTLDAEEFSALLSCTRQYNLFELAVDATWQCAHCADIAMQFLPQIPCLAIPLALRKQEENDISLVPALLQCLNHLRWASVALETLFKMITKSDLTPSLLFLLCLGSCASLHATEVRQFVLAVKEGEDPETAKQTEEMDPCCFEDSVGIFVDLQCTWNDVFRQRSNPTLSFVRFQTKENKGGCYNVNRKLASTSQKTMLRKGDIFVFEAMQPPENMARYRWAPMVGIIDDVQEFEITFDLSKTWTPHEIENADWNGWVLGNSTTGMAMWSAISTPQLEQGRIEEDTDMQLLDSQKGSSMMNPSQVEAIESALSNSVSLIWGPPAVGKTFTIVQLLLELVQRQQRILVAASTHKAVDNILRNWSKQNTEYSTIRLGDLGQIDKDCHPWTIEMHSLMKHRKITNSMKIVKSIISKSTVVFATATSAGLGILGGDDKFDAVIVDEAAQLTRANTRVATCKAKSRIVLVGDHQQLRAVVHEEAKEIGLDKSMFEHLRDKGFPCVMLDVQYRMHPSLIDFPSTKFYDGKIMSHESVTKICPPSCVPWCGSHHVIFVDVKTGRERRVDGTSFENKQEADRIYNFLLECINTQAYSVADIGVITGYAGQTKCIKKCLAQSSLTKGIAVGTVDSFQGQERKLIFFSGVRTENNVGFLQDKNRMNVLLTRAKEGLAVLGKKSTLQMNSLWKNWIYSHHNI